MDEPITRREMYLSAIAGNTQTAPEYPITREEQYLSAILENGGSGGGTRNYEQLTNKPTINGVELSGNLELADLMEDVTQEGVEDAVEDAGIADAITDAWNAVFEEEGG